MGGPTGPQPPGGHPPESSGVTWTLEARQRVRVTNVLNHQYDEAAGYPAPGILAAGGLDVRF